MFTPKSEFKQEKSTATDPNVETLIIPTRTSVATVEIGNNSNQLQPHERLLADAGRGFTLFGGSMLAFNLVVALGASYPLLIVFLAIAFPLAGHSFRKQLSRPLRIALSLILLTSLGTVATSQIAALQTATNTPSTTAPANSVANK